MIGFSAVKGYQLFRGKFGKPTIFITIAAIIFGVVSGQVLGDFFEIGSMIFSGELDWANLADIPMLYALIILTEPEFIRGALINLGLGLLFATLGVWSILKDMVSELKRRGNQLLSNDGFEQGSLFNGQLPGQPNPDFVGYQQPMTSNTADNQEQDGYRY